MSQSVDESPHYSPNHCALYESPGCSHSSSAVKIKCQTSGGTTLGSMEFSFKVLEGLNLLRMSGQLCDCQLIAEDKEFNVHKAVLVACSDYFRAMFTGDLKESKESRISLHGVSGVGLQAVIEFSYTGQLTLNPENVEEILSAASHLQVHDAIQLCSSYLDEMLSVYNCVDILKMAELFSLDVTQQKVRSFILKNFETLGDTELLNSLSLSQLESLLSEDSLVISTEYRLFCFVLRWVEHVRDSREEHIGTLLARVRLPLLSGEELVERVSKVDMIRNNERCFELLCEAKDYHIVVNKQPMMQTQRTQVRSAKGYLTLLHADNIECYDFEAHRHFYLRDLPMSMYNSCVCVIDNFLYVCGGKYENDQNDIATARCFRYDPRFDQWKEICSLNEARKDFALVSYEGTMYAIAGQDDMTISCNTERFLMDQNMWELGPSLPNSCYGHAACVCAGRIYVSGGQQFDGYSKSVLSYSPTSQEWREEPPLLSARSNHCMAESGDRLFVIGGNIEDSYGFPVPVVSIEMFNPSGGGWTACVSSLSVREAGSITYTSNLARLGGGEVIYIVGGINGQHYYSDLVQAFWPQEDRVDVIERISSRIIGRACCVLKVPRYLCV